MFNYKVTNVEIIKAQIYIYIYIYMIPIVWIWKLCLIREDSKAPKHKDCAKSPNRGNFKSRDTNHEIEFERKLDGCVHPPQ